MMRYCWLLLTPLLFISMVRAASPDTNKQNLNTIGFFAQHIDDVGTPEKAKLDAFLLGLQEGFSTNQYMQQKILHATWFCADVNLLNGLRDKKAVETIIRTWYEPILKEYIDSDYLISQRLTFTLLSRYRCKKKTFDRAKLLGIDPVLNPILMEGWE